MGEIFIIFYCIRPRKGNFENLTEGHPGGKAQSLCVGETNTEKPKIEIFAKFSPFWAFPELIWFLPSNFENER